MELQGHHENAQGKKGTLEHSVHFDSRDDVVEVGLARHDVEKLGFIVQTVLEKLCVLNADPDVGRGSPQAKQFEVDEPVVDLEFWVVPAAGNGTPHGVKDKPAASETNCEKEADRLLARVRAVISQVDHPSAEHDVDRPTRVESDF